MAGAGQVTAVPLELVQRLCDALAREGIRYCHWKSTAALDRSARGESDLDLLVARADADRFERVLRDLGFKEGRIPGRAQPPGVYHAYGLDDPTGVLVPLHVHHQLVLGDDATKNLGLPIEAAYLASSRQGPLFRVPAPELELVVFVIRMVLKHATWDALLTGKGTLSSGERRELAYLMGQADLAAAHHAVREHLPVVGEALWERCRRALDPGAPWWSRVRTAWRLERALAAEARRAPWLDGFVRSWRRLTVAVRRRVVGRPRARLSRGGAWIAVVGADGAGKTTVVEDVHRWLGSRLEVRRLHLGKPPRSGASALLHAAWRAVRPRPSRPRGGLGGPRPGPAVPDAGPAKGGTDPLLRDGDRIGPRALAKLVRKVLVSRDRYLGYVRARRFALRGGIVVSDRFPLGRVRSMDGPATADLPHLRERSRIVRTLARLEERYYGAIPHPDVLVVLRVRPETAVERRRGIEPEQVVRRRAEEIWGIDWRELGAVVVAPEHPLEEVLREVRAAIWARL